MNRLKSTDEMNFSLYQFVDNPLEIPIYMDGQPLNSQNFKETIKPKSFAYVEYCKVKKRSMGC